MTIFATPRQAHTYILEHDNHVKRWNRQPKHELAKAAAEASDGIFVVGGPSHWSKDELINYLADQFYPDVQAARDMYYASVTA